MLFLIYLLLSSLAAGIIATVVMVAFLYLPRLWNGEYYDVLGALGSAFTGYLDGRAYFIGTIAYFSGGVLFAIFYGLVVEALLTSSFPIPDLTLFPGLPVTINLFYPILGLVLGLGHGVLIALLVTIVVIEHHPLQRFRTRYILIISQLISHIVFGVTVMFFHHQFLQLLLQAGASW